ncbi:MAG: hypothetical protein KBF64_05365 [Anaerolineaceae bacterium]|nr:hypothetical protein [Anaerolineaceae bacterium]
MKAFLKNIWAALTKDPNWAGRILLILLVIAVLILAIFLSGPKPDASVYLTTPTPVASEQTNALTSPTAISSPEYVQATGVVIAVATVVLIILVGTAIELLRDRKQNKT